MKSKIQTILSIILISTSLVLPAVSSADLVVCGKGTGDPSNGSSATISNPCKLSDIFTEIDRVINWLIGLAGLYAVFNIIMAGFKMVVQSGNESGVKGARADLENAVVGFLLVMLAYLIVQTLFGIFQVKIGNLPQFKFEFYPK